MFSGLALMFFMDAVGAYHVARQFILYIVR